MNSEIPTQQRKSPFRNPFFYSSLALLLTAVYVGFVLLARNESRRAYEKKAAAEEARKRLENDRLAVEQLGGSALSIRALYVSPSTVHPGERAQLCYDVANAKAVTLDPPVAEVWPSHSRCIDLKARKSTRYTLSVTDAGGGTASQSVELRVE